MKLRVEEECYKRVFITGSNGFIGQAIAKELLRCNYEVTGSGRGHNRVEDINYCAVDWSVDYPKGMPERSFDVLIHAAARNPYQGGTFVDFFRDNIKGTDNVIRFATNHGVEKIIYLQGVSSYGSVEGVLHEDSPHNYGDDYGVSKYIAEKMIKESGIDCDILILPGVVGKECNDSFLTRIVNRISNNEDVYCYNSEGLFNNVLYVNDLVKFLINRIECNSKGSDSFLLGCSEKIVIKDMMKMIAEKVKSNSLFTFDNRSLGGFYLDIAKAEINGFKSVSIERMIDIVCGYDF